jgi:hypothetical protein
MKRKKACEKIHEIMGDIPYNYYKDPDFKPPWEEERQKALNCTDSRAEKIKNMTIQKTIIRELKGDQTMTEKRFTGKLKDGEYYIYDNGELMFGSIVKLLNEFDEEVERLKKENEKLKKANYDYEDAINEISDIFMEAYEHGDSNPYLKRIGNVKIEDR